MLKDTLNKIETEIQSSDKIADEARSELLQLVDDLKSEIVDLSKDHSEQAESIANSAGAMTHESTRHTPNEELKILSEKGLSSALKEFEASHPKLTSVVNTISDMLSGIGI